MNLIERAKQGSHEAHDSIKQVRKYSGEPYWTHTDKVAAIVATVTSDEEVIAAAHLHDVLEDVAPTKPEYDRNWIQRWFGSRVLALVLDLTDVYTREAFPDKNRAERKQLERERIGAIPAEAKTIKLADLLDNTASIAEHDKDFAQVYLREKLELLPYLSDGNAELLQRCSIQTIAACAACGVEIATFSAPPTTLPLTTPE
jgi:guanosine-3',5'-bis(diphosphate) 3'-pyrophosphohydrolase